jgi:hypothetical protein
MSVESGIRTEIERHRVAFTYLALGISIMVVALIFLVVFALTGGLYAMTGAFVVLVLGVLLYERGVRGRTLVRALEHQLASLVGPAGMAAAQTSTKYCKHCGKSIASDSSFCEHCGKAL